MPKAGIDILKNQTPIYTNSSSHNGTLVFDYKTFFFWIIKNYDDVFLLITLKSNGKKLLLKES